MSKSNTAEVAVLGLILNATAWANIADDAASSPLTNLYLALHTGDPGEGGTQATNEISYTGYARVPVPRQNVSPAWTMTTIATLAANYDFNEMTGGAGGTVAYVSLGVASSGATAYLYSGAATPNILVASGVTPRVKGAPSGSPTTITED